MYCLEYFLTILDPLSATICSLQGRFPKKQVMMKIVHITMACSVTENVHCGLLTSARNIIIQPAGFSRGSLSDLAGRPAGCDRAARDAAITCI